MRHGQKGGPGEIGGVVWIGWDVPFVQGGGIGGLGEKGRPMQKGWDDGPGEVG